MIRADSEASISGITALESATDEFDSTVARANPDEGDTGAAAMLLADALALTTEVALRLLIEVGTIADATRAAVGDLTAVEDYAQGVVNDLNSSIS